MSEIDVHDMEQKPVAKHKEQTGRFLIEILLYLCMAKRKVKPYEIRKKWMAKHLSVSCSLINAQVMWGKMVKVRKSVQFLETWPHADLWEVCPACWAAFLISVAVVVMRTRLCKTESISRTRSWLLS